MGCAWHDHDGGNDEGMMSTMTSGWDVLGMIIIMMRGGSVLGMSVPVQHEPHVSFLTGTHQFAQLVP
eukprot:1160649-Pelagomonas_calceolata.AAC.10